MDNLVSTLYVADADGSNLRGLLSAPEGFTDEIIYSDDGEVMAFKFYQDRDGEQIGPDYIYNRRTGRLTDLTGYYLNEISADGNWALLQDYVEEEGVTGKFRLLSTETGHQQPLGDFGNYSEASIASDGSYIVLAGYNIFEDNSQVRVYEVAQDRWRDLYHSEGWAHISQFLPDGLHLLLTEDDDSYRVDVRTGERDICLSGYPFFGLGYLSVFAGQGPWTDDRAIINVSGQDKYFTYLANSDGSDSRLIASNTIGMLLGDGAYLLLLHFHGWSAEVPVSGYSVVDLRSGAREELSPLTSHSRTTNTLFDFSPDGRRILFQKINWDETFVVYFETELWVFDTVRMTLQPLGSAGATWNLGAFSSDGSKIIYSTVQVDVEAERSVTSLYIADADGSNSRFVMDDAVPLLKR